MKKPRPHAQPSAHSTPARTADTEAAIIFAPAVTGIEDDDPWLQRLAHAFRWKKNAQRKGTFRYIAVGSLLATPLLALMCLVSILNAHKPHAGSTPNLVAIQNPAIVLDPIHPPKPLHATLTNAAGNGIPGATIAYSLTATLPVTGTARTNTDGRITIPSHASPPYSITFHAIYNHRPILTQTIQVAPSQAPITSAPVQAQFYTSDNACRYDRSPTDTPVIATSIPMLDFAGRPLKAFAPDGSTRTIAANGYTAGIGQLDHFDAALTGTFHVPRAGTMTFAIDVDDAFTLGIGNGARALRSTMVNPPPSRITAQRRLPVLAANNRGHADKQAFATILFPKAGTYPYEVDYDECTGGGEAFRISIDSQYLLSTS